MRCFIKQNAALALALVLALSAGCSFQQSEKVRTASFTPHLGRSIASVTVESFLRSKVAMVVSCDQILTNQPAGGNLRLPAGSGFGCAAAIDPRGYFLTASHCLTRKEAYLIVYSSNMVRAVRARVVWQGKTKHEQPDVGILHIPLELNHTFAWAPDIATDEPVMAVGLAWTNRPDRELRGFALLAGRILGHRESKRDIAYSCIENDIPLQSGDSGGPLVDLEGRLLGVNVRATPPLVHKVLPDRFFPTVAHRANQAFLRQLIEEDVSSHFKWPDKYKGTR